MIKRQDLTEEEAGSLVEALATAVLVADADLHIIKVNAAAESLLALSATKVVGRSLSDIFTGACDFIRLIGRTMKDSRSFTEHDLKLTLMSMHCVVVDCTVSPWLSNRNAAPRVIIELASVERYQRIQLEENLMLQNQVTVALMHGLAHEVKNPLGGIRGAAQLLERELEDQRQAEYTQVIIGEADRLRTLVDKMLGPRGALNKRPVNIHDVLEHVSQLVEAEHAGTVEIRRDYDPSLPNLISDRDQLVQALLNLIRNAARAIDGLGGSIIVRTRAQRKFTIGESVHRLVMRIDIIDTGAGVATDIADSIFFPMVSGHADGSGLGLPLAQAIINRQGGLIGFKSEPGWTEFTVWLPIEVGK